MLFRSGVVKEYVGGYSDWKRTVAAREESAAPEQRKAKPAASAPAAAAPDKPKKMSFAEKRELEALPGRIEALEREQAELHAHMADPEFYKKDPEAMKRALERTGAIEGEIETMFARWTELSERTA